MHLSHHKHPTNLIHLGGIAYIYTPVDAGLIEPPLQSMLLRQELIILSHIKQWDDYLSMSQSQLNHFIKMGPWLDASTRFNVHRKELMTFVRNQFQLVIKQTFHQFITTEWRHNECRDGISNQRRRDFLKSNKTSKLRVTLWGEFTGDWWFPFIKGQ